MSLPPPTTQYPVPRAGLGWAGLVLKPGGYYIVDTNNIFGKDMYILLLINVDIYSSLIDDTIDKVWLNSALCQKLMVAEQVYRFLT